MTLPTTLEIYSKTACEQKSCQTIASKLRLAIWICKGKSNPKLNVHMIHLEWTSTLHKGFTGRISPQRGSEGTPGCWNINQIHPRIKGMQTYDLQRCLPEH